VTWTRLDDGIFDHPKMLRAGEDAANLYVRALVWCNKHLTDGQIPREALRALTLRRSPETMADRLVTVGLWEATGDGWFVHDFAAHNPSRATVEAKRAELSAKRAEAGKKGGKRSGEVRGVEAKGKQVASSVSKQKGTPDQTSPSSDSSYEESPPQPPDGGATASGSKPTKAKTTKVDTAPADPGTPAAHVADAVREAPHLGGIVARPNALAAAALTAFPSIDLLHEVAKAGGWCVSNPQKAPRANGDRFLWSWLQRAHDKAANGAAAQAQRAGAPSPFDPKPAPVARVVRPGDLNADLDEYVRRMK